MKLRLCSLIVLLLACCAACGSQEPKQFAWQQIETTVDVQPDGTLQITEDLTIRYIKGTFTFIQRDLPYRNLKDIEDIAVRADDHAFTRASSDEPYTFSVTSSDGAEHVRMNYPETTSGTRTIRLSYTATGAIRRDYIQMAGYNAAEQPQNQQVWWSMVFPQRDQAVEHAIGRINLPQPVGDADSISASAPNVPGTIEKGADGAVVTASDIPPGQELTLRLVFPKQIADDEDMPFMSSSSTSGKASNAAPAADRDDNRNSLASDPRIWLGGLVLGGLLLWNLYRWLTADPDSMSDYDRGYYDGSRRWRRRSSGWNSGSSNHRSGGGGGGHSSGGGGGASGGGGGSVG